MTRPGRQARPDQTARTQEVPDHRQQELLELPVLRLLVVHLEEDHRYGVHPRLVFPVLELPEVLEDQEGLKQQRVEVPVDRLEQEDQKLKRFE